jgi:hypothetical protein
MKSLLKFGAALVTLAIATNAHAGVDFDKTLTDNYIGANNDRNNGTPYPYDVIGNEWHFGINTIRLDGDDNSLVVTIDTFFVNDPTRLRAEIGDLFLGNNLHQGFEGNAYSYDSSGDAGLPGNWFGVEDNMDPTTSSNPNYKFGLAAQLLGVPLSGATGPLPLSGSLALLDLDTSQYESAIQDSNETVFGTAANHRRRQEVRASGQASSDITATYLDEANSGWRILQGGGAFNVNNEQSGLLEITLAAKASGDMSFLYQKGSELAYHWGMTCGNDVVEGAYGIPSESGAPVPEPASLAVFGSLLGIGLASGVRRRRRR